MTDEELLAKAYKVYRKTSVQHPYDSELNLLAYKVWKELCERLGFTLLGFPIAFVELNEPCTIILGGSLIEPLDKKS